MLARSFLLFRGKYPTYPAFQRMVMQGKKRALHPNQVKSLKTFYSTYKGMPDHQRLVAAARGFLIATSRQAAMAAAASTGSKKPTPQNAPKADPKSRAAPTRASTPVPRRRAPLLPARSSIKKRVARSSNKKTARSPPREKAAVAKKAKRPPVANTFTEFRSTILTKSGIKRSVHVDQSIRRLWMLLEARHIRFAQRVKIGVRMLVGMKAKALQKPVKKPGKGVAGTSGVAAAGKSAPPATGAANALKKKPVKKAPKKIKKLTREQRKKMELRIAKQRQRKHKEFLAFYRRMLMTGEFPQGSVSRAKNIKDLWDNTRHLKKLEARVKLAEAHLAGAIKLPMKPEKTPLPA